MKNFVRQDSVARQLAKQTWKSQTSEFFFSYWQRSLGILLFFMISYLPLQFARMYCNELDWMVKNHFKTFVVASKLSLEQFIYSYAGYITLIYTLNHPFFEKYKCNTEPWPWVSDPVSYKKHRWESYKRFFIMNSLVISALIYLGHAVGIIQYSYDFHNQPSYPTVLAQYAFCFCVAEFYFYWAHRAVHHPKLYWIHKKHHEKTNTVVQDGQYVSYQECFLIDAPTLTGGILLLGSKCHFVVAISYMGWQFLSNLDDHAGYDFPWMVNPLPWCASNNWHNYHHLYNIGNYSAHSIFWDVIFGTCKDYSNHFEKMEKKKTEKDRPTQICAHTH